MHDNDVVQCFEDVLKDGHKVINDREEKLSKIGEIESKLKKRFLEK